MAPTSFFIASDALHYILRVNNATPKVKGISLPNQSELLNIQFVDITTLFPHLNEDNISNLIEKLDTFCAAFGAKIFLSKSIMLPDGKKGLQSGFPSLGFSGEAPKNKSDIWEYPLWSAKI